MKKEILISEADNLAALLEGGRAVEFYLRQGDQLVGDVILGRVESVVPGIEAAFINIGHDKNGFIHMADLPSPASLRGRSGRPPVRTGEKLIVQIAKAPTGGKGARLTGRLSIPGRFLVFVPHDDRVSISRRITESRERDRLRKLAFAIKDPGHGLIVRTEAEGADEADIKQDMRDLIDLWSDILLRAQTQAPPALLYRDQDLLTRVLRDSLSSDVDKILVDSADGFNKAKLILQNWEPELVRNLYQHKGHSSIIQQYRLNQELEGALIPKVQLPSGGSIVIEQTEALTVIDVNSGRLTQSRSLQETVLKTNLEAASEIARQLRLRDIGGIVIVDFISMDHGGDRQKVIKAMEEALRPDKQRPQITSQFSEHGLLEMSRRRQGQSLREQLTSACPQCVGLGRVRNEVLETGVAVKSAATPELATPEHPEALVNELLEEPITDVITEGGETVAAPGASLAVAERGEGEGEGDQGRRRRRRRRRGRGGAQAVAAGATREGAVIEGDEDEEEDEEEALEARPQIASVAVAPAEAGGFEEEVISVGPGRAEDRGPERGRRDRGGRGFDSGRREGGFDRERGGRGFDRERGGRDRFGDREPREHREPRESREPAAREAAPAAVAAASAPAAPSVAAKFVEPAEKPAAARTPAYKPKLPPLPSFNLVEVAPGLMQVSETKAAPAAKARTTRAAAEKAPAAEEAAPAKAARGRTAAKATTSTTATKATTTRRKAAATEPAAEEAAPAKAATRTRSTATKTARSKTAKKSEE